MSSVGFLTASGERRVSGREHGKMRSLLDDLSWEQFERAFAGDDGELDRDLVMRIADWPAGVTEARPGARGVWSSFSSRVSLYLRTASTSELGIISPTGRDVASPLETALNSAAATCPPPLALAVRISGQCEVNAWVDGEDRGWLACLIEAGMAELYPPRFVKPEHTALHGATVFSDSEHWKSHYDGWASVVQMLRSSDKEIVVLDYSMTDGFPDQSWACWPGEPGKRFRRWWRGLGPEQQWAASEHGLRRRTREQCAALRITPGSLQAPRFGLTEAWTWPELAAAWRAAR